MRSMRLPGIRLYVLALALVAACAQGVEETEQPGAGDDGDAVCGDAVCDGDETSASCPNDCGEAPRCGDGVCNGTETRPSCPGDCGAPAPVCGNGTCETGEDATTCAADCDDGGGGGGGGAVCGNGTCEAGEDATTCAPDCGGGGGGASCGDAVCDIAGGECASCFLDCLFEIGCGGGGGGGTCDHDVCTVGTALDASCGTCEAAVCSVDDYCCSFEWDSFCVDAVATECPEQTCP